VVLPPLWQLWPVPPQAIIRTAIEGFLDTLSSFSYKKQARAACPASVAGCRRISASWSESMVRGISIPAQALLAPCELSEDQRYVIRDLVEREADVRGKAAFTLGRLRWVQGERRVLAAARSHACVQKDWVDHGWA
jgi:hypothetical protein